jgi:hypothetical protein
MARQQQFSEKEKAASPISHNASSQGSNAVPSITSTPCRPTHHRPDSDAVSVPARGNLAAFFC